jgi:K+-transporting ATPase KdpF subunit
VRTPLAEQPGGPAVTWIYVVGAIVAAALLVYLLCALLKPEWFQ